jgi:hypothetical protein
MYVDQFVSVWQRVKTQHVASAVVALLVAALLTVVVGEQRASAAGSPCGTNINPVACENSQTTNVDGTALVDQGTWDINGSGDDTLQGFATDISVNAGGSISFKIDAQVSSYTIDVYRLGYYGGNGARMWKRGLTHGAAVHQPNCLTDPTTLLYDCGNWSVSATWAVPSTAVSGVYIAKLTASNDDESEITFVVRNDASTSDIVYQTSDETWQAYNTYGGSDFYTGTDRLSDSQARAFKISYNRPFTTRGENDGRDFLFSNEYPTIRFLERNGYDVSYLAGVDADRFGSLLKNHKVYMSVGHDEYWSQQQRLNVEAARDAGVSMMFLSGNEIYWHTRFEASIDGSNTAYRTLVCYKQTWDNQQTDPTGESTATWRDPRFAVPPGGGNPENALSGTMYMSNFTDLAITVSKTEGKLRLWRGTALSTMTGTSTVLAPHTIGYESDEDVDNGFRPAGLVDLSTTTGATPQYLQDFGNTVQPGTTTHHLTLYRAGSGALVFGAGTIQWGWGLDQDHDGDNSNPADSRMQQATVNMLADMHALPTTLMSGMVAAAPSADTQAPTVTITSPANNAAMANGTQITVSGSATDNGGGQVAGVEVSLDGGTRWHPAAGTSSWTYTGVLHGSGATAIKVRATDDSANVSSAVSVSANASCTCSLFGSTVPKLVDSGDASAVELGVRFSADTDGYVSGIRFYKAAANTGTHLGSLWTSSGQLLATGTFTGETSSGWQTLQFSSPVAITADTTYVASYYAPSGHYSVDLNYFYYTDYNASPLHAEATLPNASKSNGVFSKSHGFPSTTFSGANYYVDVQFTTSTSIPPSVVSTTPTAGAGSVSTSATPTATFSKAMNSSTISFTLKDPSNNTVPSTTSYDATAKTAKLTPDAALADGTLYTATISGSDINGNALASAFTWNFRTAYAGQVGGACPCTVFSDSTVPATVGYPDTGSVELGVKFTADTDGVITGIRFYKSLQNTGIHTGSLWSAAGQQLATATFTNETTTGWQTVTFTTPVPVTAGATYVASYHAPNGYYAVTSGAYATKGVDNFPLHVPAHASLYTYSTGFPTNDSDTDYGVDVVFTVPASVVPAVTAADPGNGDTAIPASSTISATFNTSILAGTTSMTVTPSGGSAVAGTTALDSVHQILTFTPSQALTIGTTYTVTITGARSLSGTLQDSPIAWSFTTGGGACPCRLFASNARPTTVDSGETSSVVLGVKIVPSVDGYISAVRFYKAAANTGTHTGSVWSPAGVRLGTVTFTNETASGWQTATLSQPVAVTAGSAYVVSYLAPNGHFSVTPHFFDSDYVNGQLTAPGAGLNGLYTYDGDVFPTSSYNNNNYWVDVVFNTGTAPDNTAPSLASTSPIDNASSVPTSVTPAATFSEPVTASTITFSVKDASSSAVAGTVSYDSTSRTVTFAPTNPLARGVTYTASVAASDTGGNAMTTPATWKFTTQQPSPQPGVCPCSIWDDTATPSTISVADPNSVELGLTFTTDTSGVITGVRFYKGPQNTGTHTASLWSATGQQLATATVTGESSTGWQTVSFASPVNVTANTPYVVSYHTSTGNYSATWSTFASAGIDTPPLHVAAHGGAYVYGAGFPANSSDANYWVDPVYQVGSVPPPDTTPPTISSVAANASGTVTWTTDEASTSRVDYGTSPTSLNLNATAPGLATSHSVPMTGLAPNTRYYYRVTSADAAGNSATSPAPSGAPASYAPAVTPITDATAADFGAGTTASTYVAGNGDGEVVSTPTVAQEFNGTTLPAGWTSSAVVTGGTSTVAGGVVTVSGANLSSTATYGSGNVLEMVATLNRSQSIGWVGSTNSNVKISFTVDATNRLIANVNDGFLNNVTSVVATGWAPAAHKFRFEWTSSAATFYLDDVQKYTHAFSTFVSGNLKPLLSDSVRTDANLTADWLRLGTYAASGTFTSRVFDAQAPVIWDGLSWDATVPTGATLTVKVRSGSTATPDATWTAFTTIAAAGGSIGRTARYVQYQLTLTSTGSRFTTAQVRSVTAAFHV